MTNREKQLIDAIKVKPKHQVFFGTDHASVRVAITHINGIKLVSVWLGRPNTLGNLQQILAA